MAEQKQTSTDSKTPANVNAPGSKSVSSTPSAEASKATPSTPSAAEKTSVSGGTQQSAPATKKAAKPAAKKASATKTKKTKKKRAATTAKRKTAGKTTAKRKATATRRTTKKAAPKKTAAKTRTASKKTAANSAAFSKPYEEALKMGERFFSFNSQNKSMEKIMTQGKNQMDKFAQEAANLGRENMEACIKSGTIWMKGCEDIIRTAMSLAQGSAEKQTEFVKEALSSKTLNEWTEVQNKIAQSSFDDFMAGATKLSELSVKVLTEATEPVNAQASKAMKKASDSVAA